MSAKFTPVDLVNKLSEQATKWLLKEYENPLEDF